jgi:phosphoserine aminotransferase
MCARVYNFSAGPAVLPLKVLQEAQAAVLELPGAGASILEISHRSKAFDAVHQEAKSLLKEVLEIPDGYKLLFLQGGSSLQFTMLPMNFLGEKQTADYILTGTWGKKAYDEARRLGSTSVAWDGKADNYSHLPPKNDLKFTSGAAYAHYTDNETIQGVEFKTEPDAGSIPLVCDTSSNFLSRPINVGRYGMIYACAQKNAGIAGVTLCIIREDLLDRVPKNLAPMLDYKLQTENDSLYNTPPVFGIYVMMLIARWIKQDIGGLDAMARLNEQKAKLLYDQLDAHPDFYKGHAKPDSRSQMNVTWRLPSEELEAEFIKAAKERNMIDLKGHRSVGGIRASIYNAMPKEGVEALRDLMVEFHAKHAK